jgi:hypothetical protein
MTNSNFEAEVRSAWKSLPHDDNSLTPSRYLRISTTTIVLQLLAVSTSASTNPSWSLARPGRSSLICLLFLHTSQSALMYANPAEVFSGLMTELYSAPSTITSTHDRLLASLAAF